MANPFGEIAANVGKEVAEGLIKKSAPVVKKAVKKVEDEIEGWGFEPKIGQVSSREYLNRNKKYLTDNKDGTFTFDMERPTDFYDMEDTYLKHIEDAYDSGKLKMLSRNKQSRKPIDIVAEQFAALEDLGVPRKYTGKIFNYTDKPDKQEYIANTLKELNPPERDILVYFLKKGYMNTNDLRDNVKYWSDQLTRPEQETFASLLNDWEGSLSDLVQLAKDMKL